MASTAMAVKAVRSRPRERVETIYISPEYDGEEEAMSESQKIRLFVAAKKLVNMLKTDGEDPGALLNALGTLRYEIDVTRRVVLNHPSTPIGGGPRFQAFARSYEKPGERALV